MVVAENTTLAREQGLSVEKIEKTYTSAAGPLSILKGADLALAPGAAAVITGPSGSGKSTLLYIIGTLDQATSGRVRVLGTDIANLSEGEIPAFRNRHIGFVFQDHALLPQCSVLDNVLIPTLAGNGATAAIEQRARSLLDRVGLAHRIAHRPAELSGGERQRVAICRALIQQPSLVLADEPTGNLDQATALNVGSLLLEVCRESRTMLVAVTHSQAFAERFPKRFELRDGLLVQTA